MDRERAECLAHLDRPPIPNIEDTPLCDDYAMALCGEAEGDCRAEAC